MISRDISFLCHRVIARIKAQVCDKYIYIYIYIYIYMFSKPHNYYNSKKENFRCY